MYESEIQHWRTSDVFEDYQVTAVAVPWRQRLHLGSESTWLQLYLVVEAAMPRMRTFSGVWQVIWNDVNI